MKQLLSKERVRRVGLFALFAVIFVALVAGLSYVFHPKNNSRECGMIDAEAHGFLGEPENTLDVLFIGDSRVYASFSPLQMWGEQGFTAHDIGTDSQPMPYTYTLLKQAFATQKPKVVVFETDTLFMRFRLEDAGFRMLAERVPFFEYHSRWKNLSLADFSEPIRTTWTDPCKGFKIDTTVDTRPDQHVREVAKHKMKGIAQYADRYMEAIVKLCRENGATLVFMSAPSTNATDDEHHNDVQSFADQFGITYVDYNDMADEVGIDWSHDTCDGGEHLNYYGAQKFSRVAGSYLKEHYELPDHRQDKAYASWGEAYDAYQDMVAAASL